MLGKGKKKKKITLSNLFIPPAHCFAWSNHDIDGFYEAIRVGFVFSVEGFEGVAAERVGAAEEDS